VIRRTRLPGRPAIRTASALPPTAYGLRPKVVSRRAIAAISARHRKMIAALGTGPVLSRPISRIKGGRLPLGVAWVYTWRAPVTTTPTNSVATNGGTRRCVTKSPFARPTIMLNASMITTAARTPSSRPLAISATPTVANCITAATERSMPPPIMAMV